MSIKESKKKSQLGMDPGTASHRLVKDILWNMIVRVNENYCCKCGQEMSRDTFSIEHLQPWLDSHDPIGLFFDLENISFSHITCNVSSARKVKKSCGSWAAYCRGCRCDKCKRARADKAKLEYCSEKRKEKYEKTGT